MQTPADSVKLTGFTLPPLLDGSGEDAQFQNKETDTNENIKIAQALKETGIGRVAKANKKDIELGQKKDVDSQEKKDDTKPQSS